MSAGNASGKPHVVLLMASQLRADVLGAYSGAGGAGGGGDTQHATPKLDLLAQRSTTFDRHFTPCPLGVPARASLWTGLYPHQHGAIISGWATDERAHGTVKSGVALLPARLAAAGYRVVHVGVQHVRLADGSVALTGVEMIGPPGAGEHHQELASRGLTLGDMSAFRDPVIEHHRGRMVVAASTGTRTGTFPLREELFYDSVLADRMVEVIQAHADKHDRRPLALLGMFWLPHPPLWAPRAWATKVDPAQVRLPATVGRWYAGQPALQLVNASGHLGAHVSIAQWQHIWAMYLGMVGFLDRCVGRVLAALDHVQMLDDAAIAFTSDHGEMLGSHGLFGKMCMYEEAVRVPLLLKLPGQSRPRRTTELTDHTDLTATLADLAGAEPLPVSSGRSLAAIAAGLASPTSAREHIFASYDGNAGRGFAQRMARSRTHKWIVNAGDHSELYDLVDDPRETINLAGKPQAQGVEANLRDALSRWMEQTGDDLHRRVER